MLLSVLYKQMIIKSAIPHRHHRARDMFALCSDSRKGSWRHAETLLATAGSTDIMVPPPSRRRQLSFLFFKGETAKLAGKQSQTPFDLMQKPSSSFEGMQISFWQLLCRSHAFKFPAILNQPLGSVWVL